VTSARLIQLSCGCVHVPTTPPVTQWPSAMSVYTDWNKHFVEPVQDAVIQVLINSGRGTITLLSSCVCLAQQWKNPCAASHCLGFQLMKSS